MGDTHHSNVDYNLHDGLVVHGAPSAVLLRGQPVIRDGELFAERGFGAFLHRGPSAVLG
jgi:dihydropyrimidinase